MGVYPAISSSLNRGVSIALRGAPSFGPPATGLLLYLPHPNVNEDGLAWDEETYTWDETTLEWTYYQAPANNAAAFAACPDLYNGSAADPLILSRATIEALAYINKHHVLFVHGKGLAVYDPYTTAQRVLNKAHRYFKVTVYENDLPTAFFNGIDTTGMTSFTGGSTTFADVDGKLRIAPTNIMAKTGMRVATTVAEGATLGSELLTTAQAACDSGWTITGEATQTGTGNIISTAGAYSALSAVVLTAGKSYRMTYDVISKTSGTLQNQASVTLDSSVGAGKVFDFVASGSTLEFKRGSGVTNIVIDNISIREVLPTYYDTTSTGTPIVASTDQVTRTGDANFQVFTNNPAVKRYSTTNPLTMPGFLCKPARTNKCTCVKANPTATTNITASGSGTSGGLSVVTNETSAISSANLEKVCTSGSFYRLNNSAGGSVATATIAGNDDTSAHARSAYIRGGTGRIGTSSTVGTTFAAAANFTRRVDLRTSAGGIGTIITANAGQIVDFILPQLEAGAFETSPICQLDQTAAETRAATVLTYPTAGKIRSNNMAFRMILVPGSSSIGSWYPKIFSSYIDLNNSIAVQIAPTAIEFRKMKAGVTTSASVSHAIDSNLYPVEVLFITTASYGMVCAKRSFSLGSWSSWTNGTPITSVAGKENGMISSTFQLGSFSGGNQFTGNISLFDTLPIPAGVTDPLAWAKQQWGIA